MSNKLDAKIFALDLIVFQDWDLLAQLLEEMGFWLYSFKPIHCFSVWLHTIPSSSVLQVTWLVLPFIQTNPFLLSLIAHHAILLCPPGVISQSCLLHKRLFNSPCWYFNSFSSNQSTFFGKKMKFWKSNLVEDFYKTSKIIFRIIRVYYSWIAFSSNWNGAYHQVRGFDSRGWW